MMENLQFLQVNPPSLTPKTLRNLEICSSSSFSSTRELILVFSPLFSFFLFCFVLRNWVFLFTLIYGVMWVMKIQRDDGIRSICKLWEFDLRFAWFIVFFLVSFLSNYAAAQTGLAPEASIPQLAPTINKKMAIVLMVLLCFFFILGFFSVYTRRCSREQPLIGDYDFAVLHDHNNNRSRGVARGLDQAILETFPTFAYSAVKEFKMGKTSLDCAVCLNAFEGDDLLRLLPRCSHVFHSECIDAWLATHSTCPICRANLLPKPGEINQTLPPSLDHEICLNESNQGSESSQLERYVSICIAEEPHDRDDQALVPNAKENRQISVIDLSRMTARSRSTGWAIGGMSQWYNSTGRELENDERFTLRLPEDVRNQILNSAVGRSRSCLTLPRERSRREGYREESEEVRRTRSWRRENPSEIGGRVGRISFAPANVSQCITAP